MKAQHSSIKKATTIVAFFMEYLSVFNVLYCLELGT